MSKAWNTDLATGIHLIDAQHRELFARIDRLIDQCIAGVDAKLYAATYAYLREYAKFHFGTEESLMDANHYPLAESHKSQHRLFEKEVDQIHADVEAKGLTPSTPMRFTYILVDWFSNHIRGVDKKLTAFLKEKSIVVPPPDHPRE
jgi:hemerythrin